MTKTVLSVTPDMPLVTAATMLMQEDFSGLPVVEKNGVLVGLLSQQDVMMGGSYVHLPTLTKLFKNFHLYKNDSESISGEIKKILSSKVQDIMDKAPLTVKAEDSIETAIGMFKGHPHIALLAVVDAEHKLRGVLARYDIIKLLNAPSVALKTREYDDSFLSNNVESFIRDFGKQFVAVGKFRTKYWLIASILFAIVGFIIAYIFILRVHF